MTCIAAAPAACPARVDGQRMVLFLRGPTQGEWRPAAEYGGFRVSVAWLEGGRAYAVQQFSNPGPQQLLPAGDEGAFLGTVSSVLALQQALDHALALPTPVARVAALRPIAASTSYDQGPALARHHAVQALARQGAAAFPTLRALVEAPAILPFVDELVMAMARADGAASVPVLVALLDEGVRYWRVQAPTLPVAWWNDLSLGSARITELRARYSVLITALRSLQSLHDPRAAGAVRALRGFWQSQLGVHDDHRQMIETCDATLGALR